MPVRGDGRGVLLVALLFACSGSTEPDQFGKLGYARFTGSLMSAGDSAPFVGVSGALTSVVCGVVIVAEYFSAQTRTQDGGRYTLDLDAPGTLRQRPSDRGYTCRLEAAGACVEEFVTFGSSPSRRTVVERDLVANRNACNPLTP